MNYISRKEVEEAIQKLPSIVVCNDRVYVGDKTYAPVIQCRDCIYRGGYWKGRRRAMCIGRLDDFYCADAVRRKYE